MRVVIPSVNYGDMLAVTLPAWRALLPDAKFTVVTSPDDVETQQVAQQHQVRLVVTDVWKKDGAVFNKGGALDKAFRFRTRPPGVGERCLSLDVDVYPFGAFPTARLSQGTIYGVPRYECRTREALEAHIAGTLPLSALPLMLPRHRGKEYFTAATPTAAQIEESARRCLGYFQAFRYTPGPRFGWSRTAGKCDLTFRDQFPHRGVLPGGLYVLHLGECSRANWRGRVVERWS